MATSEPMRHNSRLGSLVETRQVDDEQTTLSPSETGSDAGFGHPEAGFAKMDAGSGKTVDAGPEDAVDADSEWNAGPLRPVAHWVLMPMPGGRTRPQMVWEVPNPMPSSATA